MSERRWTRSLYWRIGFGFILFLALTLAAQVGLFLWVLGETEGGMPERMGRDFAELVASEFEGALARDPSLDLEQYAKKRIGEFHRPAVVFLADGRVVAPPGTSVPPVAPRMPGGRFGGPPFGGPGGPPMGRGPIPDGQGRAGRGPGGPPPMGPGPDGPPEGLGIFDRMFRRGPFGPPRRFPAIAPVRSNGVVVATIWVPPLTGAGRLAGEFGPLLAAGMVLLLIGGTALAALMIFRPAHAQLRALEDAARRLGEGDLTARAPAIGGDEVAAVSRAFNRMAGELAARQAELVEADRIRRQLLADVSHELMTPLTAIRGYAETLSLTPFAPASPQGQRAVRIIHEEGERIERLVGDLLDLARFEAGGISLACETVVVSDLFSRVIERHARSAEEKGVAIESRLPQSTLTVVGDAHRLEQALQNLASNALRHTPLGGRITLSGERRDASVVLRVADTGAGIAPDHLPHVFDRFYKADQSRSQSGSGLGLSIVKAIVERHGGTIGVRSTPGVETIFEISI
jgi:signal transduction histidine kinase